MGPRRGTKSDQGDTIDEPLLVQDTKPTSNGNGHAYGSLPKTKINSIKTSDNAHQGEDARNISIAEVVCSTHKSLKLCFHNSMSDIPVPLCHPHRHVSPRHRHSSLCRMWHSCTITICGHRECHEHFHTVSTVLC